MIFIVIVKSNNSVDMNYWIKTICMYMVQSTQLIKYEIFLFF